jgi:two-component system C4-dicarboxylate transport sensor histidine kinase DctB
LELLQLSLVISRKAKFTFLLALIFFATFGALLWLHSTTDAVRVEVRERFFDQYNRQQYLMAEQASRTLEEMFGTFQRTLDLAVSFFEGGTVDLQRAKALEVPLRKIKGALTNTAAIELTVFDRQGTVVAVDPADAYTLGRNYAWREYYQWARDKGQPGQMYLSPFMRLEGGSFRGDMALILASGIYSSTGEFRGLVMLVLNFDELVRKHILSIRIGQEGYAWLVDSSNRSVLVDPNGNINGKSFEEAFLPHWPRLYALLESARDGKPGSGWYDYEAPENTAKTIRKLVSYYPVRIGNKLWTLGVATPEREVDALLSTFLQRQEAFANSLVVTTLGIAITLLAVFFAWNQFLSNQVDLHTRDLREARSRLESTFDELLSTKKIAAVGRLALGLVHEIRNPLSAIQMNMQMIRKKIDPAGTLKENFTIVEGEIQRLNRLLKDMMDFARTRPLNLQTAELGELIRRLIQLMSQTLEAQRIKAEVRIDDPLQIVCDPEQIHQVLLNLVLNAMDAMQELPGERRLAISAARHGETVLIQISDTGKGIPPEMTENLFDPFVTTRAAGGGLGLSILQVIIMRHGGSVTVDSETDTGTTFSIVLPVKGPTKTPEGQA